MKKITLGITILAITLVGTTLHSCSGCVKSASKKATELAIDAVEGVAEAVEERGEKFGEKATKAVGTIVVGAGRATATIIEENAEDVFKSTGKILVKSVDGLANGLTDEMKNMYDTLTYEAHLDDGIKIEYVGKYKHNHLIDCYCELSNAGTYDYNFTFKDDKGAILISRDIQATKTEDDKRTYTLVSVGLTGETEHKEYAKSTKLEIRIKKAKK